MVIDKTTGIGCAWSIAARIASKEIAKELIAEGIVGKPLFRKQCKNTCRFYVVERFWNGRSIITKPRGSVLADEEIWTPSFIETGIWAQAVSQFRVLEELEDNLEKYLLPQMDEYLQSIPEPELVAMTRDFLIEHDIFKTPITRRAGNTYYFNENEVYSLDKDSKLFPYEKQRITYSLFNAECDDHLNRNLWRKAVSRFGVGMTLKECIGIFLKTELVYNTPKDQSPINQ